MFYIVYLCVYSTFPSISYIFFSLPGTNTNILVVCFQYASWLYITFPYPLLLIGITFIFERSLLRGFHALPLHIEGITLHFHWTIPPNFVFLSNIILRNTHLLCCCLNYILSSSFCQYLFCILPFCLLIV